MLNTSIQEFWRDCKSSALMAVRFAIAKILNNAANHSAVSSLISVNDPAKHLWQTRHINICRSRSPPSLRHQSHPSHSYSYFHSVLGLSWGCLGAIS